MENHSYLTPKAKVDGESPLQPVVSVEHGSTTVHTKPFTALSAMAHGYSITNSAVGFIVVVASTSPFGGPPLFIWGWLLMTFVGFCTAVSLAELSSMYPHPGGQYYYVAQLAPRGSRRFLSYLTGITAWAGAFLTCASVTLAVPQIVMDMLQLKHPDTDYYPSDYYICFVIVTVVFFGINCCEKLLPIFNRSILTWTLTSLLIVFVAVLSGSSNKMDARELFITYKNTSGWPDGLAFLIGLNGLNWCFSCLDAATHLATEIPDPARNLPKTLLWTVALGFVTGFLIILAMFFSDPEMQSGDSALTMFYDAFGANANAALGLMALVLVSATGAVVGSHTWQSRLAWSFSCDGGFPFSRFQSRITKAPFETPFWAHTWSCVWVLAVGAIYLGSEVAFSSLVSASLLFQYLSYAIPIILLIWRGRNKVRHGPFWWGPLGLACNIVVIVWSTMALVLYSFPYESVVVAGEMNYTACVFVGILALIIINWYLHGEKHFFGPVPMEDEEISSGQYSA